MAKDLDKLCTLVRNAPLSEGENRTGFPFLSIYFSKGKTACMPRTENFYIYLVLCGSLRLHTPSGIMDYMSGQYSVSKIDAPTSGCVLTRSDAGDFLALAIEFTLNEVISVLLDLDGDMAERIAAARLGAEESAFADGQVISSVYRLFTAMGNPLGPSFIGKHIKREIIFFILSGSSGSQFLKSVINIRQAGEIYEINSWIKENFRGSFSVEQLAEERNIIVSLLHQKFKSAVGMGPLQCQKRLRLTEARRLMLDENRNVTEASLQVGYESVSQFTRDYRKMFGLKPKEDVLKLRSLLEEQANFS